MQQPITHLKALPLDPTTRVFNFVINEPGTAIEQHMIRGDGVVTGDLDLQKRVEQQAPRRRPPRSPGRQRKSSDRPFVQVPDR